MPKMRLHAKLRQSSADYRFFVVQLSGIISAVSFEGFPTVLFANSGPILVSLVSSCIRKFMRAIGEQHPDVPTRREPDVETDIACEEKTSVHSLRMYHDPQTMYLHRLFVYLH